MPPMYPMNSCPHFSLIPYVFGSNDWISQKLWKLLTSFTLPHLCTLIPFAWKVLSLPRKLVYSLRLDPPWWHLTQKHPPLPHVPRGLGTFLWRDHDWKESPRQKASATPQASSFNTVSLTPNSLSLSTLLAAGCISMSSFALSQLILLDKTKQNQTIVLILHTNKVICP